MVMYIELDLHLTLLKALYGHISFGRSSNSIFFSLFFYDLDVGTSIFLPLKQRIQVAN